METKVCPFLMFEGRAEEAMNFYVSLIPNSRIINTDRYGPGQPGPEGSVMKATFQVAGQTVMCTDSFIKHGFTFHSGTFALPPVFQRTRSGIYRVHLARTGLCSCR